jgi:thymidylate synthase (FAD)
MTYERKDPVTITLRSDFVVDLVQNMGRDDSVLAAMLVSSDKEQEVGDMSLGAAEGRINSLMANKHGTPFEHNAMTFYVEAPIFVFREWHRHRIGVSYNEMSGRYSELPTQFYIPPVHRPLVKVEGTKQMEYATEHGTQKQGQLVQDALVMAYQHAARAYQAQLDAGILKEVARLCLPVATYSKMYFTLNARSMMSFLSLRTNHPEATFPSKPQWEIQQCADMLEAHFADLFPITYNAYVKNGRVAP